MSNGALASTAEDVMSSEPGVGHVPSGGGTPLRIRAVTKSFGDVQVLKGIDLDIQDGEFFTLLGPSGCGKTTLLRIIGGFESADSGQVMLGDADLIHEPPERRPFNMVFQSYALFPHMTVAENIAYGPTAAGDSRESIAEGVTEMLRLVDLTPSADRRVDTLSGGQQQRVALARALINHPKVLLLDEPLGALDLQLRKRLQDELRTIQRRIGITFVYVTHDQDEALTLSHRLALVHNGQLVQVGTPREVYEQPNSRFSAEFVGDASFVPCTVISRDGSTVQAEFGGGGQATLGYFGLDDLPVGTRVSAVLRPHHLEPVGESESQLSGSLVESVFTGSEMRHEIALEGGLTVRMATQVHHEELGSVVHLGLRAGCGVVVSDDPDQ